jgi:hypothetical protein
MRKTIVLGVLYTCLFDLFFAAGFCMIRALAEGDWGRLVAAVLISLTLGVPLLGAVRRVEASR